VTAALRLTSDVLTPMLDRGNGETESVWVHALGDRANGRAMKSAVW
jgi:hypothetical protein